MSENLLVTPSDTIPVQPESVEIEMAGSIDPEELSQIDSPCPNVTPAKAVIDSSCVSTAGSDGDALPSQVNNHTPVLTSQSSVRLRRVIKKDKSKTPKTKEKICGRTQKFKEKKPSQEKPHRRNKPVASPLAQADGCSLFPAQDPSDSQKENKKCPKSMTPTGDYSQDVEYMESVTEKLPINWPGVNENRRY